MYSVCTVSYTHLDVYKRQIVAFARRCGFPVVAKVVGPVHKSDVGGVVLNIKSEQHLALEFDRMMPVSYTHLDVYKRQFILIPALKAHPSMIC